MAAWKRAIHSVSYSGSWGQERLDLEPFLARAKALGFDGGMLMAKRPPRPPPDLDADGRRRLRGLLEEAGLPLACLAGYNDLALGAGRGDLPAHEVWVTYLGELCRLARDLGGALVRVFTAFEAPAASGESVRHDALWRTVVAGLKESARRANDLGVTLAVQNHHDLAVHHGSLADLLSEVNEPACRAA